MAPSTTETYTYDGDGERLTRTSGSTTTLYLQGVYELDAQTGTTRTHYQFGGQVIAQRSVVSGVHTKLWLHGDHLGSTSVVTNSSGTIVSQQDFKPWGEVRAGGVSQTTLNFTGQKKDGTGLLYYHARIVPP